eukprot:1161222-Pelagomonas_calceolata.AAC.4
MSTEMPNLVFGGGASSCGWDRLLPSKLDLALFFMFLHGCESFDVQNLIRAFEFTRRPASSLTWQRVRTLGHSEFLMVSISHRY